MVLYAGDHSAAPEHSGAGGTVPFGAKVESSTHPQITKPEKKIPQLVQPDWQNLKVQMIQIEIYFQGVQKNRLKSGLSLTHL